MLNKIISLFGKRDGADIEKNEITKANINISNKELEEFNFFSSINGIRTEGIEQPHNLKRAIDFLKEGEYSGFYYGGNRFIITEIIGESKTNLKFIANAKKMPDSFESHTMQLGDFEITLHFDNHERDLNILTNTGDEFKLKCKNVLK